MNDGAGRSVSLDLAQVTGSYAIGLWASKFEASTVIAANGVRPEHEAWGVGGNVPLGPVRLYLPDAEIVDHRWVPPAVQAVD